MSVYRHKKSGKLYTVESLVINCTNAQDRERMVLYKSHHPSLTPKRFVREIKEFLEKFELVSDDFDEVHLWAE